MQRSIYLCLSHFAGHWGLKWTCWLEGHAETALSLGETLLRGEDLQLSLVIWDRTVDVRQVDAGKCTNVESLCCMLLPWLGPEKWLKREDICTTNHTRKQAIPGKGNCRPWTEQERLPLPGFQGR